MTKGEKALKLEFQRLFWLCLSSLSRSQVYQVKISSFPNGENRLVFSTCGVSRKKSSSSSASPPAELGEEEEDFRGSVSPVSPSPSNLTLALNSMAPVSAPTKRSRTGRFTLDAKRKILRAGGALDVFDVKPSNCLLLTGTLPGSTKEALNEIPKHTGYIVNRLKIWIRERYKENQFSFYCWELQKRGALHIHYCVYVPCVAASKRIVEEFRGFWIRLLSDISDSTGVDLFAKSYGGSHRFDTKDVQADAQRCRKSVAAYMAKYVSKEAGRGHRSRYPSRWSGVSRPLTALIRSLTMETVAVTPGYRQGRTLYEDARQYLTGASKGCHTYPHKVGVGETRVAYYSLDRELQSCQYLNASSRLNSTHYCQVSSIDSPETLQINSLITGMYRIVQQAYDCQHSTLSFSPEGCGATLLRCLEELITTSVGHQSMRERRRMMSRVIISSLSIPCSKFLSSVAILYQEPLRNVIRSLWHLSEKTQSVQELLVVLRVVSKDLTRRAEEMYRGTTEHENLCDVGGDAKQLPLFA